MKTANRGLLVCDAGVILAIAASELLPESMNAYDLVTPPLAFSETRSTLHALTWRRRLAKTRALEILDAIAKGPVKENSPPGLGAKAWEIADQLGWAKTCDAEYVAMAGLLGCRLVTIDRRLRRGADRLGYVVTPTELRLSGPSRAN